MRVDERLVEEGLAENLALARALVMEGRVFAGEQRVEKPSQSVKPAAPLRVRGELTPYVSRGAQKLKKALEVFSIDLKDKVCLDVGASTGGFTDVMLRAGAACVYAVDVGYNQLDYRLRSDPRVVVMERQNARYLTRDMFERPLEFAATDVSFISLKKILPACFPLLEAQARFVALIKPQFEARREDVGPKGVVRDIDVHRSVVMDIVEFIHNCEWKVAGFSYSPITGPEGNIEFLLEMCRNCDCEIAKEEIYNVISAAHDKFVK